MAIPLLVRTHRDHAAVSRWWDRRQLALCGHALAETFSVLTRLPGDLIHAPEDASRLLDQRFEPPLLVAQKTMRRLPAILAEAQIRGGAVYDALVALAALEHDVTLATRDGRARNTYEAIGARVVFAG